MALGVAFFALLMLHPSIGVLAEDGPTDADLKAGYCYNVLKGHVANTCARQTIPAILADVCKKFQSDSQRLGRVDIHFVQMKALTMTSMDTKALGVCS
jgi:hypothetical protein